MPILFALNPQWEVRSLEKIDNIRCGINFSLKIRYDRTNEDNEFKVSIEDFNEPNHISINLASDKPRRITFNLSQEGDRTTIQFIESRQYDFSNEEKRELIYWLKSIGNYHLICKSKTPWGRVWRWFIDRFWLKMSPAGRRFVFLVVVFEIVTVLLLVVFIIFKMFF
ncbi:MAG: hypothetical protein N3A62_08415 [Thermodesulfovibrionales bacterium]|nr:hypothetical protein [Thermodesulfovibrionales bacterium]